VLSLVVLAPALLGAAAPEIESVTAAARAYLPTLSDKIPAGYEQRYGFRDRREVAKATVGRPIRVTTINPEPTETQSTVELLPLDLWRVPVVVDGEHRALVTVARVDGEWRAVEFGATRLAARLQTVSATIRQKDEQVALLRIHRLSRDYLVRSADSAAGSRTITAPEPTRFYPLTANAADGVWWSDPGPLTAAELDATLRREMGSTDNQVSE
jgi:hypothetical protein